jgi:hypothetical protein
MADTNHVPATSRVEGDGVSYRGVFWFGVVLAGTTLFCQALVWGMFGWMQSQAAAADPQRPATAAAAAHPTIEGGHVATGLPNAPSPDLLVDEPTAFHRFRTEEEQALATYGLDKSTGAIRIPIDRAKEIVLAHGLPTRPGGRAAAPAPTAPPPRSAGKMAMSSPGH